MLFALSALAACESDPAPAACGADVDCKGDRICVDGRCVDPGGGGGGAQADAGGDVGGDAGGGTGRDTGGTPGEDVPHSGADVPRADTADPAHDVVRRDGLQQDEVVIAGVVYDLETTAPIEGALVTTEPPVGQLRTGADGRYEFRSGVHGALEVGAPYRITASAPGYVSNWAQVTAALEAQTDVNIPLQRATGSGELLVIPGTLLFGPADFPDGAQTATKTVALRLAGPAAEQPWTGSLAPEAAAWLSFAPDSGVVSDRAGALAVTVDRAGVVGTRATGTIRVSLEDQSADLLVAVDLAETGACLTGADWDLAGDGSCDLDLFWDEDCQGVPDEALDLACGKVRCHFTQNVCEAMEPCGALSCLEDRWVVRACPNDPDCVSNPAHELPALPCQFDGHCDVWCPLHEGWSIDPDCGAGGGQHCPGQPDYHQCTDEVLFRAVLKDYQTRIPHADGACYLLHDIHDPDPERAATRVSAAALPAGFSQPLVSTAQGVLALPLPAGSRWGFECDKGPDDVFRTTFQFVQVPADPATAPATELFIVPNGLYSLAPALGAVDFDTGLGAVYGRIVWRPAEGAPQPVGCATLAPTGGDVRYSGLNDLPVPPADEGGRDDTHPANGRFLVLNLPLGRPEVHATLGGQTLARAAVVSSPGAVSVVELVTGEALGEPLPTEFPTNPTPAGCD